MDGSITSACHLILIANDANSRMQLVFVITSTSKSPKFGVIGSIIILQPHTAFVHAQDNNMNMNPIIMHIHPQLSVLIDNAPIEVPEQIGINPSLWNDHSLDKFGMQPMPEMNMSAMAPLHTHDNSGIIYVESTVNRNYTLGEFLNIWGLNVKGETVNMTVNDEPLTDIRNHLLRDGEQIKLDVQ
jgi:hypothetical protein